MKYNIESVIATTRTRTIYEGRRANDIIMLFAATELITIVCAMQLIESGKIKLEDSAKLYVPEISNLRVLTGFDQEGSPITRPTIKDITIKDLIFHTSGLGEHVNHKEDIKYRMYNTIPMILSCKFESIQSILLHEPGEKTTIGIGVNWLGKIIESVCNKRLGEVMKQSIFEPLEMADTSFILTDDMKSRRIPFYDITSTNKIRIYQDLELPPDPEMDMGGIGLYSSAADYNKFIKMLLNNGGSIISKESVDLIDLQQEYNSGFIDIFYWFDRKNGIGGFWGSQSPVVCSNNNEYPSYYDFIKFKNLVYERSI